MIRRLALAAAGLAMATSAMAADPKQETEHVVKAGETLGGIANRAEVPRVLIIEANGLRAPYTLRAGQKLVIPRRRSHTVKDGETGLSIAMEYGVTWQAIAQANGLDHRDPVRAGQKLAIPTVARAPQAATSPSSTAATAAPRYAWPVTGRVRRDFNAAPGKDRHDGIDILAASGTAVRASAAGTVIFAANGPAEYGKTVILFHGDRWTTTYAFLDRITVKDGERVAAGERIGLVGQTGLAREPQLHFEVRRNKVPLDPKRHLPAQP